MNHLDLFSGIGGFALAVETVWPGSQHMFCELDPYCQALLKLRFTGSKIYGDIRQLTADTDSAGSGAPASGADENRAQEIQGRQEQSQPESCGQRGATSDTERGRLYSTQDQQELESKRGNKLRIEQSGNMGKCDDDSNTERSGQLRAAEYENNGKDSDRRRRYDASDKNKNTRVDLLTGGFPCQPFSQAGKRRGTDDNRFLWPEMLRVIREFNPRWVIAENVRGILTIEQGVVFEQICLDLEREGYEVQAFIIPAVAKNAPHRRDRVWFCAHSIGDKHRTDGTEIREAESVSGECGEAVGSRGVGGTGDYVADTGQQRQGSQKSGFDNAKQSSKATRERPTAGDRFADESSFSSDTTGAGLEGRGEEITGHSRQFSGERSGERWGWDENWLEVATELCGVDDGVSAELDEFKLSKSGHRVERLKALGNSIVSQVAVELMQAIKRAEATSRLC